MLIDVISGLIVIIFAIMTGIPTAALIVSLKARILGRYLNGYFSISKKKTGGYELHHHPTFGFYYASRRKFYRMLDDAIRKFQTGYPDQMLVASTLTFSSRTRGGSVIAETGFPVAFSRLMADFLVLCNFANYRRADDRWRFAQLIRDVHRNKPMRFVLVKGIQ
ncbi:hypothetical protein [Cohnella soli]|uniref:Uncharacterized protein n=1 Tax=Cohnella soli TaxID=425005 RepID=A0ABW0HML7_9BACL